MNMSFTVFVAGVVCWVVTSLLKFSSLVSDGLVLIEGSLCLASYHRLVVIMSRIDLLAVGLVVVDLNVASVVVRVGLGLNDD